MPTSYGSRTAKTIKAKGPVYPGVVSPADPTLFSLLGIRPMVRIKSKPWSRPSVNMAVANLLIFRNRFRPTGKCGTRSQVFCIVFY